MADRTSSRENTMEAPHDERAPAERQPPPPPPTDAQPPPPAQPVVSAGNGVAVAALVCGLIGVVTGIIPVTFFLAWVLGILAVVFGLVGRRRAKAEPVRGGRGMATWGFVLGILSIGLGVLGAVIVNDVFEDTEDEFERIQEEFEEDVRELDDELRP